MVTEDCVCCGVAKLLKEKGFNEKTYCYYTLEGEIRESLGSAPWNNSICETSPICAPTIQMATKWLRKEHKCILTPSWEFTERDENGSVVFDSIRWSCEIVQLKPYNDGNTDRNFFMHVQRGNFTSPEEAIEDGIKYCLENLV